MRLSRSRASAAVAKMELAVEGTTVSGLAVSLIGLGLTILQPVPCSADSGS